MFSFHCSHNTASTDFTVFLTLIEGAEGVLNKFKLIYLQKHFITGMFWRSEQMQKRMLWKKKNYAHRSKQDKK